ncbi:MAG TPA: CYTH domain-containing protein [Candidatus Rifleibacterium sp.]|nr:CYTH domain-containing protein [Candidatus Rifleibacterium sp.]HPT45840.1 CYTH domain-containing protein [Candidatus Rifleibacterium sp.]
MGKEIERKFLVRGNTWKSLAPGILYRQGYLVSDRQRTVRVRLAGNTGYLTIKGETSGATRDEYEYEIPAADAVAMLDNLCAGPLIEKRRHKIAYAGQTWEVDEFTGDNTGLVVAEIELCSEDQQFELPVWVGAEVTEDPRYYNASLVKNPYKNWK